MRKLATFLAIIMLFVTIAPVNALAEESYDVEISSITDEEEYEVTITTENGEKVVFFKEGLEYKFRLEDGTVAVWAYDTPVIDTNAVTRAGFQKYYKPNPPAYSGWTYTWTERWSTNIDYEMLDLHLGTLTSSIDWIEMALGAGLLPFIMGSQVAAAYIYSYRPEKIYRDDDRYVSNWSELYIMVKSFIYKDSNYSNLVDTVTRYYDYRVNFTSEDAIKNETFKIKM